MGGHLAETKKKTKKRWRIGGNRHKSKPKEVPIDEDEETEPTSPESSSCSFDQDTNHEDHAESYLNDLPPAMSEVEESDSDSDDDDLYLENSNDNQGIEKFSSFSKAPQPLTDSGGDDDFTRKQSHDFADQQNGNKQVDLNDSDSSFEEEIERYQQERRNSPHFTDSLAKISEQDENSFSEKDEMADVTDDIFASHDAMTEKQANPPIASRQQKVEDKPREVNEDNANLPSHREISKTLCKLVATEHYSGLESLIALEKLSKWAHTQDSNLLKHFLTYGGVVKVVDFMDEQIDIVGASRETYLMESIHKAADVICNVCFVGKHGINEDIAVVNATVVVKYGGIETLVKASNAYNRCGIRDDPVALKAAEGVWNAIMNVYCNAEAAVTKEISTSVLDAAIEMMSVIGSVDHAIATETLANVFNSLYRIIYHDFVSTEEFHEKDLLNQCLNIFKRDVKSSEGDEELLEEAMSFLYGCHEKSLLNKGSDYESVLPLCVMGLREFALDNDNIREWASKLLDGACSNIENKASIMMAEGAIEAIAPFLTYQDVGPDDKEFMRNLIRKIVSPV